MRIMVYGRNLDDLYPLLDEFPVEFDESDPEIVISYGGDGTLLGAERDFPGIPKCPIRDSRSSAKCEKHGERAVLSKLFGGELKSTALIKLQGRINNKPECPIGMNDVVIDRKFQASAIRYRLWLDDLLYARHIVGDGVVLATPFGSSGYYRSITHSMFTLGLGLAFNNSTEVVNHLVIEQQSVVEVEITRGPAVLFADNDLIQYPLDKGDRVTLSIAPGSAVVLGLNIFRCPDCYWLRHYHERPLVPLPSVGRSQDDRKGRD